MYLSSIQQGIQAAHVISDMFITYNPKYEGERTDMLQEWATNHKTMILLNGGYSSTIRDLYEFFNNTENPYPFESFNESDDALDGALTSVGIILPEKIYEGAAACRGRDKNANLASIKDTGSLTIEEDDLTVTYTYTKWEFQLIQKLNQFGLAS